MLRFKFACRFIIIAVLVAGNSASISARETSLRFRHISVENGLSRNWVNCIYKDSYGLMWFGTSDGLNKYNGVTFEVYNYDFSESLGLNGNTIVSIYEDRFRRLWVGTPQGLNLYDRGANRFIPTGAIENSVDCFYELDDGSLFIGSPAGLFLYNPSDNTFEHKRYDIYIETINKDKFGRFWLGTRIGLYLLDTTTYNLKTFNEVYKNRDLPSDVVIRSVFSDSQGNFWLGTHSHGIYNIRFNNSAEQSPELNNLQYKVGASTGITKGAVLCFEEGEDGSIWAGIENGGINIIPPEYFTGQGSITHYQHNPTDNGTLSGNSIHSLYLDDQHTMWVGTFSSGISYYNAELQKFELYKQIPNQTNSLNNNAVNVIWSEGSELFLGTEGGLNILNLNTGQYQHFVSNPSDPSSLGSDAVWSIYQDSRNNIWVGTWEGGLNLFNPKKGTFTRFIHNPQDSGNISSNSVYDMLEDSEGNLWLATMGGGLNRYDYTSGKFTTYLNDYTRNSISNDWVVSLLESSLGEIWIASTIAVDIYNKETNHFTAFVHDPNDTSSISYNGAIMLFEDSRGTIWLGTFSGLNYFVRSDSSFRSYRLKDGLPDNTIRAIAEDEHGNLWLTTNNGLSKFVNGIQKPSKPRFINFGVDDGLQRGEFNDRAICADENGKIYIGGNKGFNAFHPDSIRESNKVPDILLTGFLIFNKPVQIGGEGSPLEKHISLTQAITLTRKQSVFSIEYAALNYYAPDKIQYAFTLEGFEKEWNYVGSQKIATYTNLDPGDYVFKVTASENNTFNPDDATSLAITVLPPWWASTAAKLVYTLLIILALYFFRRYTLISINLKNKLWLDHMNKQKDEELNKLKLQFFTNISHELRTPLTLIAGPLERLMRKTENPEELRFINRNVIRLKTLIDQLLDFRRMENDTLELKLEEIDVIDSIYSVICRFEDFAIHKGLQLIFKSGYQQLILPADADKLDKIVTNLLFNAINYTPENGVVRVTIDLIQDFTDRKTLQIQITDTGKGISKKALNKIFNRFYSSGRYEDNTIGAGIGLHLTQRLIDLMGGSLEVKSEINKGSEFLIQLPVDDSTPSLPASGFEKQITHRRTKSSKDSSPIASKPSTGSTLVVIDDNVEMLEYMRSLLDEKYQVFAESNSQKGIEKVQEIMPDLVISDVMMPEIDGLELCRKLKSNIQSSHIPIILLTAKTAKEDHISGLDIGADDYIYKPFDESILISRIENLIRQRIMLREHFIGHDLNINPASPAHDLDKDFANKVLTIIKEQCLDPNFSVNRLLKEIGMSKSVFYKKFAALSDITINELIRKFRLQIAEKLLRTTSSTISEIAYQSGFNDPSYFIRVFKEGYHCTPKEFQENLKPQD